MITEIAFYVYPVTDVARSRKFYEKTVGLKLSSNFGNEWVEYEIGAGTFAITSMDAGHKPGVQGGCVAFEVDDLDAEVLRLKERAVAFVMDMIETPVCRFAVVADPDDNHFILHRRKA